MVDEKYNEALKIFIETDDTKKSLSVYLFNIYFYIVDFTR